MENLKFKAKSIVPSIVGIIFLAVIAIMTAINPDSRFSFYIGCIMMVIYFSSGFILYKKGKIRLPHYEPYLQANINNSSFIKDDAV